MAFASSAWKLNQKSLPSQSAKIQSHTTSCVFFVRVCMCSNCLTKNKQLKEGVHGADMMESSSHQFKLFPQVPPLLNCYMLVPEGLIQGDSIFSKKLLWDIVQRVQPHRHSEGPKGCSLLKNEIKAKRLFSRAYSPKTTMNQSSTLQVHDKPALLQGCPCHPVLSQAVQPVQRSRKKRT